MNFLYDAMGEFCKIILPIDEKYYLGNPDSKIAICTLSSIDLLQSFSNPKILNNISIVGRLLSENKGIDSIVDYVYANQKPLTIIVCGKEVSGHKSGHSLFQLYRNGVDGNKRIIGSISPDPFLTVTTSKIEYFQDNVKLVNLINEVNYETILKRISDL